MDKALETHLDTVASLIKNGADLSLKDNEGHTATDFDYKPPDTSLGSAGISDAKKSDSKSDL